MICCADVRTLGHSEQDKPLKQNVRVSQGRGLKQHVRTCSTFSAFSEQLKSVVFWPQSRVVFSVLTNVRRHENPKRKPKVTRLRQDYLTLGPHPQCRQRQDSLGHTELSPMLFVSSKLLAEVKVNLVFTDTGWE